MQEIIQNFTGDKFQKRDYRSGGNTVPKHVDVVDKVSKFFVVAQEHARKPPDYCHPKRRSTNKRPVINSCAKRVRVGQRPEYYFHVHVGKPTKKP